jgi:hypothetical protein
MGLRCLIRSTRPLASYVCNLGRCQPQVHANRTQARLGQQACAVHIRSTYPVNYPDPSVTLLTRTMSQTHSNASSSSNFQSVFNAALDAYEKKTESNLLTHPLAAQIQSCGSPTAILSVLRDLIQQFDQRYTSDQRLTNWPNATVKVLYAFSGTLGDSVGHVSPN